MPESTPVIEAISLKDLNLHPKSEQAFATEDPLLATPVSGAERMTRLERFSSSEFKGLLGHIEDTGNVIAGLIGADRAGQEVYTCEAFASQLDSSTFQKGIESIFALPPEEQAKALSCGLETMEPIVNQLMETRAQSTEVNLETVGKGLKDLKDWYVNGTAEDQKKIDKFFTDKSVARTEMWAAMDKMWAAQKLVDVGNYARRGADVGMPTSEDDHYSFSHAGGPLRKLVGVIQSIPGGVETRAKGLVAGVDRVSDRKVSKNLAKLRSTALASGEGTDINDITMWRKHIVSTKELGGFNIDDIKNLKVDSPLTPKELSALKKGKEISDRAGKFVRASQADQITYFVGYDEIKQIEDVDPKTNQRKTVTTHVDGFFDKQRAQAEKIFFGSRDKYLGYSTDNPAWKNARNIAGGIVHAIADADIAIGGLPAEFTELMVKVGDYVPGRLLGVVGKGLGESISFGVDSMESEVAKHALEQLASLTIVGQEATKNLARAIDSNDRTAALDGAAVVRGWNSLLAREAMDASRKNAIVAMTRGKNLAWSTTLAIPELGRAAIEGVTGGILVDEQTRGVIGELVARNGSLDGDQMFHKYSEKSTEGSVEATDHVQEWFATSVKDIGISAEYMTMEAQRDHLEKNVFNSIAEMIRKTVGPDTWLQNIPKVGEAFKPGGVWEILTEGSRREAVNTIQEELAGRLTGTVRAANVAATEFTSTFTPDKVSQEAMTQATELSTLLALEASEKEYAEEKFHGVKRRQQLDTMYSTVSKVAAFSGAVAVVGFASNLLQSSTESLEDLARHSMVAANEKLQAVQAAAIKIKEITSATGGMGGTDTGVSWDVFWKKAGVGFLKDVVVTADLGAKYMAEAKYIAPVLAKATLILGAARGAWEAAPLRSKLRTKFWQSTKVT